MNRRSSSVPLPERNSDMYSDESDSWSTDSDDNSNINPLRNISPIYINDNKIENNIDSDSCDTLEGFFESDKIIEAWNRPRILLMSLIFMAVITWAAHTNQPVYTPPVINQTVAIDWWGVYNSRCCVTTNTTGIYAKIAGDCSSNGFCGVYLNNWLQEEYNQTYWESPWIKECCYQFNPINSARGLYCSYPCLNTVRN